MFNILTAYWNFESLGSKKGEVIAKLIWWIDDLSYLLKTDEFVKYKILVIAFDLRRADTTSTQI